MLGLEVEVEEEEEVSSLLSAHVSWRTRLTQSRSQSRSQSQTQSQSSLRAERETGGATAVGRPGEGGGREEESCGINIHCGPLSADTLTQWQESLPHFNTNNRGCESKIP